MDRYLTLADQLLPARIEGLYLVGSLALHDYQPGKSDVDFVAVTHDALMGPAVDALGAIHQRLQEDIQRPWFDGVYVTWTDLARNPEELGPVPSTHEGRFSPAGGFEANPSTWVTLRNHPLPVRGPARPDIWHDPDVVRRWNLANLNSYWRSQLVGRYRLRFRLAALLTPDILDQAIAWCVPGITRLHYTTATCNTASKSGACRYALERFPDRWHPIIADALALRNGGLPSHRGAAARYRDMLAYMQFVIDDANSRAAAVVCAHP